MTDYTTNKPKKSETPQQYALRQEADGARELHIRKGLRDHFDLPIADVIEVCSGLSNARHIELLDLRTRFPEINENRLAWRISKSLTIPKDAALVWAQTIITAEAGV